MARDPLHALATLRRLAVDAARQELAKCELYQSALDSHIHACDQAISDNEPVAHDPRPEIAPWSVAHGYLEKLSRRSNLLRQHVPIAQTRTEVARDGLLRARLAEKAIAEVSSKRDQARSAEADRRDQRAADDMAHRAPRVWKDGP